MTAYYADKIFKDNIQEILSYGTWDENPRPKYSDGTPAHTKFITDIFEKYPAGNLAPITELRPIAWKTAIREMLWIYNNQTSNLKELHERKVFFWDEWEVENTGTIGQRYGATVRKHDIINNLLKDLEEDKFGRRHVINLWQEDDFKESEGLKPCAFLSMYTVTKDPTGEHEYMLNASLTIRSSDFLTAASINRIQYKALQLMLAKHLSMSVGTFSVFTSNMHIYDRHMENAKKIRNVALRDMQYNMAEPSPWDKEKRAKYWEQQPQLILNVPDGTDFYDIKDTDFELKNYNPIKHEPKLKFDLGI